MSAIEEPTVVSEPTEKTKKSVLRGYRQKLMTIKARIKYRKHALKTFTKHLKNGTFPQRMKSIKPYPKMNSPEAQAVVNASCDQVQCVILDQMIQMIQEEEKKLTEDQERYEALKVQRQGDRQHFKTPKNPKKSTVAQLQQELADLQAKYTQLCKQLKTAHE